MSNVFSFLQDSARKYPDKSYVIDKDKEWNYRSVYKKVILLSEHMKFLGINNGDRILIYLDNSIEYISALFAVFAANAVAVPINKSTTLENLSYIVSNTTPAMIISNEMYYHRVQDKIDFGSCVFINIEMLWESEMNTYPAYDSASEGGLPAMILYTSGTTRLPKGVILTHNNLVANTNSILEYLELTPEDSILATINFSYSYGNSLLMTHTKVGGTIIIENRISYPVKILERIYQSEATGFSTVGSYINILLKQDGLMDSHFKHLRYITFAGESTNFEDIIKLNNLAPHIKIFVMYGQTEATARLSYLEPVRLFEKAGSIGRGIPGVILRVVSEDGRDVRPGEIGEIIASGDNIMKGYWNNEEDTKAVIKDGWLYTGDLATLDEEGYIYVKGRKDDIIKYLGHRISPVEIESVINTCESVLESAVVGIENNGVKQIKAFVTPKNKECREDEIYAHIKKSLPPFKRPHIIEFIPEIPRTTNGKIKRSELRSAGD